MMTKKISYVIIDDELKAIRLLQTTLSKYYGDLEMAGSYSTWETALEAMEQNDFDLLFLDISMPHKTGISLLEMIPEPGYEIIFVTAHEEHALKAYKFAPSGYILKPIKDSRLIATVDKAIKRIQNKKMAGKYVSEKSSPQTNKIGIRNNKGLDYVDIDDILFCEATARYTKVITKDKQYLSSYNIGKFKTMLEQYDFYPVHRSYIVNIKCIKRYESSGMLVMEQGHEIPVAKSVREDFLKLFNEI